MNETEHMKFKHEPEKPHASTTNDAEPFNQGQKHSHALNDPKDTRKVEQRAAAEKEAEKQPEPHHQTGAEKARAEGREPSRGVRIDEEIENEEHEYLKRKGKI